MARPEPKRWGQAALGGALVALGGALFGAVRRSRAAGSETASRRFAPEGPGEPAQVRTKPEVAEEPARTRYWPPPAPKPIAPPPQGPGGEAKHDPVDPRSVKQGYERFDAKPGTVVKVMLFGVTLIVGCIAALFYLIGAVHRGDTRSPPLTPQQLAVIVPPGPRLQDHPLHDIAMQKKREADLLDHYAWTGSDHRTARIPIARAQALVIGRSLDPLPPASPAAQP